MPRLSLASPLPDPGTSRQSYLVAILTILAAAVLMLVTTGVLARLWAQVADGSRGGGQPPGSRSVHSKDGYFKVSSLKVLQLPCNTC